MTKAQGRTCSLQKNMLFKIKNKYPFDLKKKLVHDLKSEHEQEYLDFSKNYLEETHIDEFLPRLFNDNSHISGERWIIDILDEPFHEVTLEVFPENDSMESLHFCSTHMINELKRRMLLPNDEVNLFFSEANSSDQFSVFFGALILRKKDTPDTRYFPLLEQTVNTHDSQYLPLLEETVNSLGIAFKNDREKFPCEISTLMSCIGDDVLFQTLSLTQDEYEDTFLIERIVISFEKNKG